MDLGFERKLFQAADKLRNNIDAAQYKHVVLGLVFLKYISDCMERGFRVPAEAHWPNIRARARQPMVGRFIDDAMAAIERDNPVLNGVLPKNYGQTTLDQHRLKELVELIGTIGLGGKENRSRDILGRVYEYFLGEFAACEGKKGGQFYTPRSVVRVLVEMLAPYRGRVYDPCCGSGGMFVQSEKFIEQHGGTAGDISFYGQESNPTTWRLARMNLAIRGVEGNLGSEPADSLHRDLHEGLRADFILANPPFNSSDWGQSRLKGDVRWKYGIPPANNANFAWVQHIIRHLAPEGMAGFVLANGSMSSNRSGEGEIRRAIVEDDLVDCMVALPGQLFYSTQIPACLWLLSRDKSGGPSGDRLRDRRGEFLFIDARKLGALVNRTQRELTAVDIECIASTYHAWRGDQGAGKYEDIPGLCQSATLSDVQQHQYVLAPGRYVGGEEIAEDGEPFAVRFPELVAQLEAQFAESGELEAAIRRSLRGLEYAE